jgi:hypothetical protein
LEEASFEGRRGALETSGPDTGTDGLFDREESFDGPSFGPEGFALGGPIRLGVGDGGGSTRISAKPKRGEMEMTPDFSPGSHLGEKVAREVVFVPASRADDHRASWFEAVPYRALIPLPESLTARFGFGDGD